MDLTLFEFAPLYIPTDLRKLISSFAAPIHAYLGCAVEDRNYIHVLGVFRTLIQAAKICLDDANTKRRIAILKMEEGDVLPYEMVFQIPRTFPLSCNRVFHPRRTWMENALHYLKNIREILPSPLDVGETVYIDEGRPYVLGEGGPRKFVLSLSKTSRKNIDFYNTIESTWKIKLHPKGGGIPRPYKFYVQ